VEGVGLWDNVFLQLVTSTGGIYFFYLYYGMLQEKINRPHDDGSRFTATYFLLFVQCLFNFVVARVMVMIDGGKSTTKDVSEIATMSPFSGLIGRHSGSVWIGLFSASYISAMLCSNLSLQYVSYPFQALAKSCKMVPVMMFNFLLGNKKYSILEVLVVLLITAGVVLFRLAKSSASFTEGNSAFGLFLLFGSLGLDGVTTSSQRLYQDEFQPTSYFLMSQMNLLSVIFLTPVVAMFGEHVTAMAYISKHPSSIQDILLFSICSALGQLFIFYSVVRLGPLATTTITTTRKFFTVLISVLMFPENKLNRYQQLAVAMVFLGLGIELLQKYTKQRVGKAKRN